MDPEAPEAKQEGEPAAPSAVSQDSDSAPLMAGIQTKAAQAAAQPQAEGAGSPRSPAAQRAKAQHAEQPAAAAKAEGEADGAAAQPQGEEVETPKSPPGKRKKPHDAEHLGKASGGKGKGKASAPREAPKTFQRKRAKSWAPATGDGEAAGHGVRSREGTPTPPDRPAETPAGVERPAAEAATAAPAADPGHILGPKAAQEASEAAADRAAAAQKPEAPGKKAPKAATAAAAARKPSARPGAEPAHDGAGPSQQAKQPPGQQRQGTPSKTGALTELERVTEGLQRAQEAHDRLLPELKKLDSQVRVQLQTCALPFFPGVLPCLLACLINQSLTACLKKAKEGRRLLPQPRKHRFRWQCPTSGSCTAPSSPLLEVSMHACSPGVLLSSLRRSNLVAVFTGAGLFAASEQDAADGASAQGDRYWEAGQKIHQME